MKVTLPLKISQSRLFYWKTYIFVFILLSIIVLFLKLLSLSKYVLYALFCLSFLLLIKIEIQVAHNNLTVHADKILLNKGVLKHEHSSASFDKISDFRVYQNIGQRLLGYGTLFINTMSEHDLYLFGVRRPYMIKELLAELEHKRNEKETKDHNKAF